MAVGGDEEPQFIHDGHPGAGATQGLRATGIAGDPQAVGQAERVFLRLAHDGRLQQRACERRLGIREQSAQGAAFVLGDEQRELRLAVRHARGDERFVGGHRASNAGLATLAADDHDGDGIAAWEWRGSARVVLEDLELVGVHGQAIDGLQEHEPAGPRVQVLEAAEPTKGLGIAERADDVGRWQTDRHAGHLRSWPCSALGGGSGPACPPAWSPRPAHRGGARTSRAALDTSGSPTVGCASSCGDPAPRTGASSRTRHLLVNRVFSL
jgi:hypothetical protein